MSDAQAPPDDEMLARLSAAFDADLPPVPRDLMRFAADAGRWMAFDDELAALEFDSATDAAVGARSLTSTRRTLRFRGAGLTVSMSVDDHSLVLLVEPGGQYTGRLSGPGANVDVVTDGDGQFSTPQWPAPVRVEFDLPNGRFVSPWVIG